MNGPSKNCVQSVYRPYNFNLFKGCIPQILLGLFLNSVFHISFTSRFPKQQK